MIFKSIKDWTTSSWRRQGYVHALFTDISGMKWNICSMRDMFRTQYAGQSPFMTPVINVTPAMNFKRLYLLIEGARSSPHFIPNTISFPIKYYICFATYFNVGFSFLFVLISRMFLKYINSFVLILLCCSNKSFCWMLLIK